ncbi:high-affinity methionine permease [Xylariaceae sp. FL1651]|nr:high-affinity methionine permease [Xylariaceae sp. FL1651]
MGIFSKFASRPTAITRPIASESNISGLNEPVVLDGRLTYTVAQANNGSRAVYQEAAGAPVESKSPLGYHVGWAGVMFLNVNEMIGTGIFSTPGTVLNRSGSVGLALFFWVIGIFLAFSGFSVYLELASYFPNRSGSKVVYLEQAYPRPRYLFPITFAVYSVVLSSEASNAIILSDYLWALGGLKPTAWQEKGVAVAAYTVAVICVLLNTKFSLWAVNIIGGLKITTLVFISITAFVVLGGHVSRVPDPGINFRNAFEGTTTSGYDLSVAIVNIIFAYTGYANAFSVVNEIKNPIPTLKKHGAIPVAIVSVLYILCNIAYFSAVPKEVFAESKTTAASVFFGTVFGSGDAQKALNFLVLLSAFGNLLAVLIGQSRLIREIGRQGVLPFTTFWVSTKPFGTPLGPYAWSWLLTTIVILAPPPGDAFQFIISLKTYPDSIFNLALFFGVYLLRHRYKQLGRARPEFKTWHIVLLFFGLAQLYTLATPWIPPKGGVYAGEVSFWYATYIVVGIGMMHILPKWGSYQIRPEMLVVEDRGANTHRLVKVPLAELEKWDEEHDEAGHLHQRPEIHSFHSSCEETMEVEKKV